MKSRFSTVKIKNKKLNSINKKASFVIYIHSKDLNAFVNLVNLKFYKKMFNSLVHLKILNKKNTKKYICFYRN